jgi:hypothetical protein
VTTYRQIFGQQQKKRPSGDSASNYLPQARHWGFSV